MSDPSSHRRRLSLLRPLLLAAAGVAVLGLSVWLSAREDDTAISHASAPLPTAANVATVTPAAPEVKPPAAPMPAAPPTPPVAPPSPQPAPQSQPAQIPQPAPVKPRFDIVRVSPDGDAVIAGRAEPGATVVITSNGHEIGRVQADGSGQFVFVPTERLPAGGQELSLEARLADQPPLRSDGPVLLVVPGRQPPLPPSATAGNTAKDPGSEPLPSPPASLAVLTSPNAPPRLLQGPAGATGKKLGLDVVDYDQQGAIRFAGKAPPQTVVRLYVDNKPVGETRADANGQWSLTPSGKLAEGPHQLRLDQVSPAGKVMARVEIPFQRAALTAQDVPSGRVVVQPEQSLWRIARQAYGEGIRYTDIFAANREKIRDPDLIFPGQILSLPAVSPIPSASSTSK